MTVSLEPSDVNDLEMLSGEAEAKTVLDKIITTKWVIHSVMTAKKTGEMQYHLRPVE
jgi:hypothetical protein